MQRDLLIYDLIFADSIGCADQVPQHMNIGQYIASNVPSLKGFNEPSVLKQGKSTFNALSKVMVLLQRCVYKLFLM